jgi:hypothetical protein
MPKAERSQLICGSQTRSAAIDHLSVEGGHFWLAHFRFHRKNEQSMDTIRLTYQQAGAQEFGLLTNS